MSHKEVPPRWQHELRALRDHDRAHAPSFEAVLAEGRPRTRRGLLPAAVAALAAIVAVWIALPRLVPSQVAPVDWSGWRSPTAALLAMGFGSTRSPTTSLNRPLELPERLR